MFGRATIRLGIGPHSSFLFFGSLLALYIHACQVVAVCPTTLTRRPASADSRARRQFQATGQPVSRTQASDAMTSRLPRYHAKYVCNAGASNAGRSLCIQMSRQRSYPLPIYWYHSKRNWLRYNFAADSVYIMKLCSRLFFLYCRNCPKDDKFRYFIPFWGS